MRLSLILLVVILSLSACGGGVPGAAQPVAVLPPPEQGLVGEGKDLVALDVAGNASGSEVRAIWLARQDPDAATPYVLRSTRLNTASRLWETSDAHPFSALERGRQARVRLFLDEAGRGLALLESEDGELWSLRPNGGGDWEETRLSDPRPFVHFLAAVGGAGLWAVFQGAGEPPALARYAFPETQGADGEWVPVGSLPAAPALPRQLPPALAVDADGVIVAYLGDGSGSGSQGISAANVASQDLLVARWNPGSGSWSEPQVVASKAQGAPVLCPHGRVLAWSRLTPEAYSLHVAVEEGGAWRADTLYRAPGASADVRCVDDGQGRALVVWMGLEKDPADGTNVNRLWAAFYDGSGWGEPERLASPDAGPGVGETFDLAGLQDGQALVVFHRAGERGDLIQSRRFHIDQGWLPARQVNDCCAPARVAMALDGTGVVMWKDNQGRPWWARLERP